MWRRSILVMLLGCAAPAPAGPPSPPEALATPGARVSEADAAPRAEEPPRPVVAALLGPDAAAGPRSEVLVLGTVHLRDAGEGFRREALAPVLASLERFRPTVICVEHLPPRDIAEMDGRGGTFRQVAEMFARGDLRIGRLERKALRCSREEAAARAEALLSRPSSLDAASRRELVAWLVAAYDSPTALLHWSLLPPETRKPDERIPADVARSLDGDLASSNEIATLAIPLARAAGLTRLVSVDSQRDGARLLAEPESALEEAFGHPLKDEGMKAEVYARQRKLFEEGKARDLLPLYRFVNSPGYGAADVVAQWRPWLRMRLASGVDRFRYGNWESRNARIVANLTEVTASARAERVLLVIGVAHKPFVEDGLARLAHVRLASFADLAR